ncbi:MAG: hypothetical protein IPI57_12820 [Candidatus Competibacteraceae bacterium]|nr:hypothetical protein [Candidatus Competibacteraceae bacterium]
MCKASAAARLSWAVRAWITQRWCWRQLERVDLLDKQLGAQAQAIQDRNALIAQANDMLTRVQQLKNQAAQNNGATDGGAE